MSESSNPKPANKSKSRGQGPQDPNVRAWEIVQQATKQMDKLPVPGAPDPTKDQKAVTIGRMGGIKGGKARKEALTPERRKEIAKKAAEKRWQKA